MTRRISSVLCRQKIDYAGKSVIAGVAEPKAGVYVVLVKPAEFHGKRAVEQHDYFVKLAAVVYHLQKRGFVVVESHDAHCGVGVFRTVSGKSYDCRVAEFLECVFDSRRIKRLRSFVGAVYGHETLIVCIFVVKRLIDVEAAVLKRLCHIYYIGIVRRRSARAASVYNVRAVIAEKGDVALVGLKGQSSVVLQKNRALLGLLNTEVVRIDYELFVTFVRKLPVLVSVRAALQRQSARCYTEEVVDVAGVSIGKNRQR